MRDQGALPPLSRLSSAMPWPRRSPVSWQMAATLISAGQHCGSKALSGQPCGPSPLKILVRHALSGPVASLPEDGHGVLVRDDRLLESSNLAQGAAEVVQCYALAVSIAGLLKDGSGVLKVADRFLRSPRLPQGDAEVVQGVAFTIPVAGLPVDGRSLLARGDRLVKPAHRLEGEAKVVQRVALTSPIGGLPVDGRSVLVCGDRLVKPTHLLQGAPEVRQRVTLVVPFAEAPGDVQADGRGGKQVIEPPPQSKVLSQQQGKPYSRLVPATIRRHLHRSGQAGPFRVQPGQGTVLAGELLRHGHPRQHP